MRSWSAFHLPVCPRALRSVDPHSRWKGVDTKGLVQWAPSLAAFNASRACVAGSPDHEAPLNTGMIVVKPRRWLYADVLQLLSANLSFRPTDGFNGVGRPHALTTFIDVELLAQGSGLSTGEVGKKLNWTQMYARNDCMHEGAPTLCPYLHPPAVHDSPPSCGVWTGNFVAGSIDQGLFWYVCFVRHAVGTWTSPRSSLWMEHYWGSGKPWREAGLARPGAALRYLWRLSDPANGSSIAAPSDATSNAYASDCHAELRRLREKIFAKFPKLANVSRNLSAPTGLGWRDIAYQPALPFAHVIYSYTQASGHHR